jgi:hypothetical protein
VRRFFLLLGVLWLETFLPSLIIVQDLEPSAGCLALSYTSFSSFFGSLGYCIDGWLGRVHLDQVLYRTILDITTLGLQWHLMPYN